MEGLTPRQQEVLDVIRGFVDVHGYAPSMRDIGKTMGISGTVGVMKHLQALERKGHLRRSEGTSRAIVLSQPGSQETIPVPIAGVVRAGLPALAVEDIEGYYPLDRLQLRGGAFFLRIRGDSMINDAILENDLALIRPQATAQNGDIVVAMIDGEATVKRFYRERRGIRLQPANPNMDPIIVPEGEEVVIVGKVVKIIRDI